MYCIFLWLAPNARKKPAVTMDDTIKMMPVTFCYAGALSVCVIFLGRHARLSRPLSPPSTLPGRPSFPPVSQTASRPSRATRTRSSWRQTACRTAWDQWGTRSVSPASFYSCSAFPLFCSRRAAALGILSRPPRPFALRVNMLVLALFFYRYNELSTTTLKKTVREKEEFERLCLFRV